jgi:hypothetical protein
MKEEAVVAAAAEELFESGGAEEVQIELERQRNDAFPTLLVTANALKDLIVDPIADFSSWGIITYLIYLLLFVIPLWVANILFVWGKLTKMQSIGRTALGTGWGRSGVAGTQKYAMRQLERRFKNQLVLRVGGFLIGSLVPIVNIFLLQTTLILFAHHRHNKLVKGILAGFEAIGYVYTARGNPLALRRVSEMYAEDAASYVVREANISGMVGDKLGGTRGFAARQILKRADRNIVRVAKKRGGRTIARGLIGIERARREGGAIPPPRAERRSRGGGGPSVA